MIRRLPRSTLSSSSAASDVYKRQVDAAHAVSKKDNGFSGSKASGKADTTGSPAIRTGKNTNRFNNFSQRKYDFNALEKQIISKKD